MNFIEISERIEKGANIHTEFKEKLSSNEELAKDIVCFANTDGGQILLGVNKKGIIVGVDDVDMLSNRIDDIAFNRCEPPISVIIEAVEFNDKTVIVMNVPKGDQKPYKTAGGLYYIRSDNRCQQASRQELLRLFQDTESMFYDKIEIYRANIQDINIENFSDFIEIYMNISARKELIKSFMKNLSILSKNEKPTLAGILFFGNNPQYFIPYSKIIGAYIDGEDISIPPTDRKDFIGRIPEILQDCMKFLKLYLKERHIIKGLEPEAFLEIPELALREALVNAIAHRDYTISSPIRVLIFNSHIEYHTPGKLPNTVTIESMKIGGSHVLRNPTIYNLLAKMGLVTDLGSGVRRIIELTEQSTGKEIDMKVIDNEFILTLPRK